MVVDHKLDRLDTVASSGCGRGDDVENPKGSWGRAWAVLSVSTEKMNNETQFVEVILDGPSMYIGVLPWLSMLAVPVIAIRSLFFLRKRGTPEVTRSAGRCFLGLHIQSTFCFVSAAWFSLGAWWHVARTMEHGAAFLVMLNINMSHMLWPVAFQCFLATVGALVVMACSGCQPRLWHPRYSMISIALCACAQAMAFGVFGNR